MRNPIRRILFITPLILAEFHNAGQIFLFGNLGNVTQSKKRNFAFRRKLVKWLHKFPKKEICDTDENSPLVSVKIVLYFILFYFILFYFIFFFFYFIFFYFIFYFILFYFYFILCIII